MCNVSNYTKNADLIKSTEINFLMHNYYLLELSVLGRIQPQQHSLLSQASWGRLEMKPKRDEKTGRHVKGQKEHKIKVHDRPLNL
jgi:hypothetical protein